MYLDSPLYYLYHDGKEVKNMQSYAALSKNLKSFRKVYGFSQEYSAELCDISARYWRKLEHNRAVPSATILFQLSDGMHLSIGQLFDDELVINPDPSLIKK